ncbi:MAG: hypothetical protein AAF664_26385, partial [Planctomycetota bacterium]
PGTGDATAVMLLEDVPEGFEHPRGRQLDNLLGDLQPGEIRRQVLRLRAATPGMVTNTIRVESEDGVAAQHSVNVQVIAPALDIQVVGPSRRFLERPAGYQVALANNGTADATNVAIELALDRGFTFVSTDFEGRYDPSRHTIRWSLEMLPAGQSVNVPVELLPIENGTRAIRADVAADLGIESTSERSIQVEGFAETNFTIRSVGGPIEMGSVATYEIDVRNSGSMEDTGVQLRVEVPDGMEVVSADSDGRQGSLEGDIVVFPERDRLSAGQQARYQLQLRGVQAGTHLIRAALMTNSSNVPVRKEESTLVYLDQ